MEGGKLVNRKGGMGNRGNEEKRARIMLVPWMQLPLMHLDWQGQTVYKKIIKKRQAIKGKKVLHIDD